MSAGEVVGWSGFGRRSGFCVRRPFCDVLATAVEEEVAGVKLGTRSGAAAPRRPLPCAHLADGVSAAGGAWKGVEV